MFLSAFLILLSFSVSTPPEELRETIENYWELLSQGDKAAALSHVATESRNAFIARRERPFQTWEVVEVEPDGADRFRVSVDVGPAPAGGRAARRIVESWGLDKGEWKVSLTDGKPAFSSQALWRRSPRRPEPGTLKVLPKSVRIHFIGANQTGNLWIENGLDGDVELDRIEFDREKFQLTACPDVVPAGGVARLSLRYVGDETQKSLSRPVVLTLRRGANLERFESMLHYNVVSQGARALFGLTERESDALRRGDRLTPRHAPPSIPKTENQPTLPAPRPGRSRHQEFKP